MISHNDLADMIYRRSSSMDQLAEIIHRDHPGTDDLVHIISQRWLHAWLSPICYVAKWCNVTSKQRPKRCGLVTCPRYNWTEKILNGGIHHTVLFHDSSNGDLCNSSEWYKKSIFWLTNKKKRTKNEQSFKQNKKHKKRSKKKTNNKNKNFFSFFFFLKEIAWNPTRIHT